MRTTEGGVGLGRGMNRRDTNRRRSSTLPSILFGLIDWALGRILLCPLLSLVLHVMDMYMLAMLSYNIFQVVNLSA